MTSGHHPESLPGVTTPSNTVGFSVPQEPASQDPVEMAPSAEDLFGDASMFDSLMEGDDVLDPMFSSYNGSLTLAPRAVPRRRRGRARSDAGRPAGARRHADGWRHQYGLATGDSDASRQLQTCAGFVMIAWSRLVISKRCGMRMVWSGCKLE